MGTAPLGPGHPTGTGADICPTHPSLQKGSSFSGGISRTESSSLRAAAPRRKARRAAAFLPFSSRGCRQRGQAGSALHRAGEQTALPPSPVCLCRPGALPRAPAPGSAFPARHSRRLAGSSCPLPASRRTTASSLGKPWKTRRGRAPFHAVPRLPVEVCGTRISAWLSPGSVLRCAMEVKRQPQVLERLHCMERVREWRCLVLVFRCFSVPGCSSRFWLF